MKQKPDLKYNIVGTGSAWDCVDRCYKKFRYAPNRTTVDQLRSAIKNLHVWAVELTKTLPKRMVHRHGWGRWTMMLQPRIPYEHRGCAAPECICREKCCYQQRKAKA